MDIPNYIKLKKGENKMKTIKNQNKRISPQKTSSIYFWKMGICLITFILLYIADTDPITATKLKMIHQANVFNGSENTDSIYFYRNNAMVFFPFTKKFNGFAINIFDFETEKNEQMINNPLFGGGRTETFFLGGKYIFSENFILSAHNGAIYIYEDEATVHFVDMLYFDPIFKTNWKITGGKLNLTFRARNVIFLTPVNKQDFREKIELGYLIWKDMFEVILGNELNINLWPYGNYQSNDIFAGFNWHPKKFLTVYTVFNMATNGPGNYWNIFLGLRLNHSHNF
jgi:hypothetical protein